MVTNPIAQQEKQDLLNTLEVVETNKELIGLTVNQDIVKNCLFLKKQGMLAYPEQNIQEQIEIKGQKYFTFISKVKKIVVDEFDYINGTNYYNRNYTCYMPDTFVLVPALKIEIPKIAKNVGKMKPDEYGALSFIRGGLYVSAPEFSHISHFMYAEVKHLWNLAFEKNLDIMTIDALKEKYPGFKFLSPNLSFQDIVDNTQYFLIQYSSNNFESGNSLWALHEEKFETFFIENFDEISITETDDAVKVNLLYNWEDLSHGKPYKKLSKPVPCGVHAPGFCGYETRRSIGETILRTTQSKAKILSVRFTWKAYSNSPYLVTSYQIDLSSGEVSAISTTTIQEISNKEVKND